MDWSQMSSMAAVAKVRYSDSVLERATVRCLQEDQEIIFGPRKTQKPPVDFLSPGQPTQ
jgi:3-polyprenyl-4-hydroxybenzoate decarboxylase